MIYTQIEQLLVDHLQTVQDLPDWQKENVRYTTKGTSPFIRSTLLPAQPSVISVGQTGTTKYQGYFQVDCFGSQDTGTAATQALSDRIQAAFTKGLLLEGIDVKVQIELSYRQSAYQLGNFYGVPVLIQWVCYH